MNKQSLAKISILMFLSAVPTQIAYTADMTVPSWAYESVQELANDGIVTLPPGVDDAARAKFNRKDMALLVAKAMHNINDKGAASNSYQLATDSSVVTTKANEILRSLERKNILTNKKVEKQDKKQVEGQFDMYNYKLAEIAHEVDKINLNELTPIDALNTLVRIKEKMK